MEIAIKLSQFLLSLSLLIILHELGHFIPAKIFKTKVEKFYLFFDVKYSLFKKKIGETVYGIGWLPLGGYVKIAGMIDESMDKEQMAQPPKPWEFRSKPAWQRLIIMLGGVTVNFILAIVIYIGMAWAYGDLFIKNNDVSDGVWVTSPLAEEIGFKTGDKIISINGETIENFNDVPRRLFFAKNVVVEREGNSKTLTMPVNLIEKAAAEKTPLVALRIPFVIGQVDGASANKDVLQKGDLITSLNGETVKYFDQAKDILEKHKGQDITATVIRKEKNEMLSLNVSPEGKLGVVQGGVKLENYDKLGYYNVSKHEYSFFESIPAGLTRSKNEVVGYFEQLKAIISPETGAYKSVGGFYAIFDIFPNTWSWQTFWGITAILSIMLGVMNLLPIPALDGGHVMFLLYEMITGRKPSDKFMEYAQMAGFFILIALLLFANGNDIYKGIMGK